MELVIILSIVYYYRKGGSAALVVYVHDNQTDNNNNDNMISDFQYYENTKSSHITLPQELLCRKRNLSRDSK